ncbi:unnamed protein product [Mycena citricolor]|uniref:Uncharacterized protein n=1 Tax=Mycena citricolor TaxID=2018698 RepID=A0AAD2HAG8_9AGAR|nr:unnamed protein product [Mycena citricolor]
MLEKGIGMDQPDLGWRCWGEFQIHSDEFTAITQLLHTHIPGVPPASLLSLSHSPCSQPLPPLLISMDFDEFRSVLLPLAHTSPHHPTLSCEGRKSRWIPLDLVGSWWISQILLDLPGSLLDL